MHTKEKFHLTVRWMCFALLLFAAVVRLAAEPAVRSGLRDSAGRLLSREELQKTLLLFGSGAAEPETAAAPTEKTYPLLRYTPPRRSGAISFTAEDAALVDIRNAPEAEFDAGELITRPLKFDANADGPLILIVHTHATEAYTPTAEDDYEPAGEYHTTDTAHSVVQVGQVLADRLSARGIAAINDDTLNDLESYNDSYLRSAEVIEEYLEKYPSIQMVIDLHRDAIEDAEGGQLALTAELDGASCARLLLVMGTNVSGMYHPNWQDNLSCALKIQALAEKRDPGWFRQLSLRSQRYNEHLTPCSILLEVGAAGNTLDEAVRSAERFGDLLADLIEGETTVEE